MEKIDLRDKRENSVIVTDMDEVLTNISPLWYRRIRRKWDLFAPYLKDFGELSDMQILAREEYYIQNWLKRDDIELPPEIHDAMYAVYRDDDFYSECQPTRFGAGIAAMVMQSFVSKIYIVTHTIPETKASKEKFYRKYFHHPKVELVMMESSTKKSEFIKTVDYNLFIDDRPEMLIDVMQNTNSFLKEFMMPELGYNNIQTRYPDLIKVMEETGSVLRTYKNVL